LCLAGLWLHKGLSGANIFVERDLGVFFIPPRYLWVEMVRSGEAPFWNAFNYSGIPLLATLHPGILYPPNALFLILPFPMAWNWLIILHFVLAGTATHLFLRYLRASPAAAFLGGLIFMLSGYLLSVHNLLSHLLAVSWFPLTLMAYLRFLDTRRACFGVLAALSLSMEFLAGAPEIVIMTLLALTVLTAKPDPFFPSMEGSPARSAKGPILLRRYGMLALILILFLLITGVQLLPFQELSSWSIRRAGLPFEEAVTWSLGWKDLIQFFLPDPFGYGASTEKYWANQSWLKTIYLGIAPFLLSLFFFMTKDRRSWLLLGLMLLGLLLALGSNTPLYRLLYLVPPFSSVRYPVKFLFLFVFGISVTAALGFDSLRKGIEARQAGTTRTVLLMFYGGFAFAVGWGLMNLFEVEIRRFMEGMNWEPERFNDISYNIYHAKRFLLFSFMFCVALLVWLRVRYKRFVSVLVIALVAADLFVANHGLYYVQSWREYVQGNGLTSWLKENGGSDRYVLTPQSEQSAEIDWGGLHPRRAAVSGLYTIDGSEVLRVFHQDRFLALMMTTGSLKEATRFFDIAGVRYLVTAYRLKDAQRFRLLRQEKLGAGEAYLYEYLHYPGRFLFFHDVYSAKNDEGALSRLQDPGFDLRRRLILQGVEEGRIEKASPTSSGRVRLVTYKAKEVVLECDADSGGFLYMSDTYYPGWRAYVDGKRTTIYRANLAFRAVYVPAGAHTAVFRYVPMSFYIGLGLTLLGIALCIWFVLRDRRRNKNGL
jgi:hypothetical protein